jgi:putative spermidine/putrescine transport system substrate-binding protein
MKNVFRILIVMGVIIGLTATSHAAKKYDGQTMQVMSGISPLAAEQIRDYIAPKLKEKYGIEIAVEAVGSAAMLEKIVIMKNNPRITIAGWDAPVGARAAEMGLCATIDLQKIPNVENMYDWCLVRLGGDVKVLTTNILAVGLLYNEDEFKRRGFPPPTSWNDLWKKEYSGRVSIVSPESTMGLASLAAIARMEGGGENNIDPGFKKLKTLLPNMHTIHTWSSECIKLMQLGEVWIAIQSNNIAHAMRETGFPARWVAPKEGAPTVNGGISIVANAPYQDVAYDYLNLYYSHEFQLRRMRESGASPPIKTVWDKLSPKDRESLSITDRDFGKLTQLDWAKIGKERATWVERWKKEMK